MSHSPCMLASLDMHKGIVQSHLLFGSLVVINGTVIWRSLGGQKYFTSLILYLCIQVQFSLFTVEVIGGHLEVIRGHQRSLLVIQRPNCVLIAAMQKMCCKLSFDMHKVRGQSHLLFGSFAVISTRRSLEVIRDHQEVKHLVPFAIFEMDGLLAFNMH